MKPVPIAPDAGPRPVLIVVGGLPATGKTTVSRAAADRIDAAYLRIDTIEQAVVRFAAQEASGNALRHAVTWGLGYGVTQAVASDLLSQGLRVLVECVNPLKITRDAWREVATSTGAHLVEVELVCSNPTEHKRRATTRTVDIPDLALPTWADILAREYEPWDRPHLVLDTAGKPPEDTITELCEALPLAARAV